MNILNDLCLNAYLNRKDKNFVDLNIIIWPTFRYSTLVFVPVTCMTMVINQYMAGCCQMRKLGHQMRLLLNDRIEE